MFYLIKDKIRNIPTYRQISNSFKIVGEWNNEELVKLLLCDINDATGIPEEAVLIDDVPENTYQCLGSRDYGFKLSANAIVCASMGISPIDTESLIDKAVNHWFETELAKGYLLSSGVHVDCKDKDISRWTSTKVLMDTCGLTETQIVDYNNQSVTLTSTQYLQLVLQVGSHFKDTLITKNLKRNAAYSATTDIEFLRALLF